MNKDVLLLCINYSRTYIYTVLGLGGRKRGRHERGDDRTVFCVAFLYDTREPEDVGT